MDEALAIATQIAGALVATTPNPTADLTSGDHTIVAISLATGAMTKLLDGGTFARYVPTGHVAVLRNNALMAAPFDPRSLAVSDARVTVVPDVFMDHPITSGNFAVSASGALAYTPGAATDFERTIVAIDPARVDARTAYHPRLVHRAARQSAMTTGPAAFGHGLSSGPPLTRRSFRPLRRWA